MTEAQRSPRHTLTYLRDLFEAHGIRPKSKLGQNFLIDLNLLNVVVRAGEVTVQDLVLEVGTGTGSLTALLADDARAVVSVEVDLDFYTLASANLLGRNNVMLLRGDILLSKNVLDPEVMNTIREVQARSGARVLKLIANLPYAVATPTIANLLLSDLCIERMVVMVQQEIAERMLALPGTREYGALAVLVQSLADVEAVRRSVPPAVFWPRPQVASAIIIIRPNAEKRARIGDVRKFRHFLRDLYTHRRKNLRGALTGWPSGRRDKSEVDQKLVELGLDGRARAETLDLEQHRRLYEAFA